MPITLPPLPYTPIPAPRPFPIPAPYAPAQGVPQFVPGGPNWASGGGVQVGSYVPQFQYQPIPPTGAGTFPPSMLPPPQAGPSISSQVANPVADASFEANQMLRGGTNPVTQSQLDARIMATGQPPTPGPMAPAGGMSQPQLEARLMAQGQPLPPPPIQPTQSMWTKNLTPGKFGGMAAGIGTGIGANLALGAFGADRDYNSTPLGRVLGATRRGIGTGAWAGPVGGIVGGLGAGLGQSTMEAGHAVAGTGVGEAIMEPGRQGAEARQSDNFLDKAKGWGDLLFSPGQLPAQALSGFVRDMGSNDPAEANVGNVGQQDKAAEAQAQAAANDQRAAEAEKLRQQRIAMATPDNLDAALGRLNVSSQTRQQVLDEFNSQAAVIGEMYLAGGLTIPQAIDERDGKLYLKGTDTEIPADQVDTVKGADGKDTKVAYRQATEADVDDMRAQTYQQILQSLPEVVQADRQQTEQMNRMLGYSAALQSVMEPYAQQANALADTYAAQAGANPMIAPLADAFRVGQQGIANAYQGQAAALPFQIMLEQQAKTAQQQAEQQAVLERQLAVERYKAENGNRQYPGQGADALSGLNLGG